MELRKTLIYVVAALAMSVVAILSLPSEEGNDVALQGEALFPEFDDALKVTKLTIVKPEGELKLSAETKIGDEQNEFIVMQRNGRWVLPSFGDYPADGDEQLMQAATALVDLKVLGIASEKATDHEKYGVVQPLAGSSNAGRNGVGLHVRLDGAAGSLADLIIGKADKNDSTQRFVRKGDGDTVYVVKTSPDLFPTNFSAWIDQDLLKLNPLDIKTITFDQHQVVADAARKEIRIVREMELRVGMKINTTRTRSGPRNQVGLVVEELTAFPQGEPQPQRLLLTEELNGQAISQLIQGFAKIPIKGVDRKPAEVGVEFRQDFGKFSPAARKSLKAREYFVLLQDGRPEIFGDDHLIVETKIGVQYHLFFGGIAGVIETEDSASFKRYLLIAARVNESLFPKPELAAVPPMAAEGENQEEFELRKAEIEKQNGRLLDEWNEEIGKARQVADSLNARFADWYYIIDQATYETLHLNQRDLIVEKPGATARSYNVDAFRELEELGLTRERPELRDRGGFSRQ